MREGLTKTRKQLFENIDKIFSSNAKLDEKTSEALHEVLFRADLGVQTCDYLVEQLSSKLANVEHVTTEIAMEAMKEEIRLLLEGVSRPENTPESQPRVILVVGVNGVGKTTSVGKLASYFKAQGKSVLLAAADTYRAAAIEQLGIWAEKTDAEFVKHQANSDPAAVAFDAVKSAMAKHTDVVLVDTAGRLHNKKELMNELAKIRRVMGKDLPEAPHETWLVVDATTGQNAFQQIQAFTEVCPLTGLVVTKLDGTAKGGVVVGASDKFKLPVRFIGVGEKAEDLRPFDAKLFAESLF